MRILYFLAVAAVFTCIMSANADTKIWNGDEKSWYDYLDWNPQGVPTSSDDVVINLGWAVLDTYEATAEANSVSLNGGKLTVEMQQLQIGTSLQVGAELGEIPSTLSLLPLGVISCGSFYVSPNSTFVFNGGTLNVNGGGFQTYGSSFTIDCDQGVTSKLVLNGNSGYEVVYDEIRVGYAANNLGQLEIRGGREMMANAAVGIGTDSHGTVIVSGTNSVWEWSGGEAAIAKSGRATITVEDGGYWDINGLGNDLLIADDSGSRADITITGNGSTWNVWNNGSDLILGHYGTASLTIENGGVATMDDLMIGMGSVVTLNGGADGEGRLEIASMVISDDATLCGGGGRFVGNLENAGKVQAGSDTGVLTIQGNYTQQYSGDLLVKFLSNPDGDEFGKLAITGNAILGGTLTLDFSEFSTPSIGSVYEFLTAGDLSGEFSDLSILGLDASRQIEYDMMSGSFTVVPEPATAVLMAVSIAMFVRRRNH